MYMYTSECVCVCVCVCSRVRAHVHTCMCACVHMCVGVGVMTLNYCNTIYNSIFGHALMFKVECQLQFPTGMTRVHCHSSCCCRQTVQTCKWRCHLPVHDPHGQDIMEKFHSSRDEEVEILVPWEGRDVERQTKVACSNRQPAKGTEVTIEDRCETNVTPCHAYMIGHTVSLAKRQK